MSKWRFNYESGEYEDIDKNGFSYTQGKYVNLWDDSEFHREEEDLGRCREQENW